MHNSATGQNTTLRWVGMGLITALLLGFSLVLFDFAAWYLVPDTFIAGFPDYRRAEAAVHGGRGAYPRNYFTVHPQRGFDIAPDRRGWHEVEGERYPIWSNSMGCFDKNHPADAPYVYLAGDSHTWGYSPWEKKFGTLLETKLGQEVYKCGVTHTGQRHQLEKLQDIARISGTPPAAILVFWYYNDIANDRVHPHSTVVDGWQADTVKLDDNLEPVRIGVDEIRDSIHKRLVAGKSRDSHLLQRISLSFNLLIWTKDRLYRQFERLHSRLAEGDKLPSGRLPGDSPAGRPSKLRSLYDLPPDCCGHLDYMRNHLAAENQAALLAFRDYAREVGAFLGLVVIPPREHARDGQWHTELHQFLLNNGIPFLDLASEFQKSGVDTTTLFHARDGHMNEAGNRVTAELVAAWFTARRAEEATKDRPSARSSEVTGD